VGRRWTGREGDSGGDGEGAGGLGGGGEPSALPAGFWGMILCEFFDATDCLILYSEASCSV